MKGAGFTKACGGKAWCVGTRACGDAAMFSVHDLHDIFAVDFGRICPKVSQQQGINSPFRTSLTQLITLGRLLILLASMHLLVILQAFEEFHHPDDHTG